MNSPYLPAAPLVTGALLATFAVFLLAPAVPAEEPSVEIRYEYGPDSIRQESVPQGTITEHVWSDSKIYPGTLRRYWIYVPAQYEPSKAAALMVFQDGHAYVRERGEFRTPIVLDNLIHEGAMPVTIGVFVDPGTTQPELPPKPGWEPKPENRSVEYDTLSPDYANFLLTEILPAVQKDYNITDDPEGHAIAGISSGGIAAFTTAWERPDAFRKVLSHVGSFTNIRGGDRYPGMIRKGHDKRPMRIFLQDGRHDLDNAHGNWWLGNLQMDAALKFAGYDYKFVAGEGAHNGNHGGAILPDSLRWLWRDYKLPQ
ncbi:alpha/beta hydrolase [Lacipirellula limnantheis]|uniref:Enterobactin/ferric enterobactin esterase n=1 Tax=Lacipirellula limnantheis TaxID=2528024 RepID=A0A517U224_9BACT|nr:alpha/beta hydrolase-fold protein [Lacipirellula limnantheis]QDT74677.1 enterobactin/ferric enterobactin esterase [Lacipirellula limnantheis]